MERLRRFFVFFFVAILAITMISCNHLQPSRKISVSIDTTIYQGIPITQPLYSCGTGERRPYDKLLRMESVPVKISLRKDTIISGNALLPVTDREKSASNNADLDWFVPIAAGILGMLILIAALLVAAYLLYRLIRFLFTPRPSDQAPGNHPENAAPNQQSEVVAGDPVRPNQPQTRDEVSNRQLSMAEGIVAKQQIHKINQKTKSNADGSWESEITIETKNEKGAK